ncbi:MAG: DUF882 domain-containing protein [Prevotella sp.]|nr:DUF882 domain-containing protein [Prevotella sp.]
MISNVVNNKQAGLSEHPHLTSSSEATPHFTLAELCKTKVNLRNVPNEEQVENLKRLCGWLEQLRRRWNNLYGEGDDPIVINSGFRSPEVNKAVGGATLSNHLTGCAVDIRCVGIEQALRYAVILLDISDMNREDYDELLIEQKAHSYWIHFAVKASCNRRRTNFIR